jgi:hypothetical protein
MRTDSAYLTWLGGQLAADAPPVRRATGAFGPDLVMGYATGYGVEALAPFVRSLRTVYDGRIALYVDRPEVEAFLDGLGVDRLSPPACGGWTPTVAVSRFGSYLAGLKAYPGARHVLLTDVRDVVFQGPPLAAPVAELEFYPEHGEDRLADDVKNLRWLRRMFGGPVADQLAERTCLCAGTIVGRRGEIEQLCRLLLFLGAIPRSGVGRAFGADQAAFNLAAYHGLTSGVQRPNFGRVATLQRTAGAELAWRDGRMVNPDGTVSPIVHKYDRHPHIETEVRRLWAPDLPEPSAPRRRPSLRRFIRHAGGGLAKRLPELR